MRVEARRDGYIGAQDRPRAAQQFAFRIGESLRHHRPMQIEVEPIHRPLFHRSLEVRQDQRRQPLERLRRHRASGIGEAPGQRRDGPARRFHRADGAGGRHGGVPQPGHQGCRALHRREAAGVQEIRPARRARGEGMAFMLEAANRDPHHASPRTSVAEASTASASTISPASAQPGVMLSASLWLMPPWQGTKSIAAGSLRAT